MFLKIAQLPTAEFEPIIQSEFSPLAHTLLLLNYVLSEIDPMLSKLFLIVPILYSAKKKVCSLVLAISHVIVARVT